MTDTTKYGLTIRISGDTVLATAADMAANYADDYGLSGPVTAEQMAECLAELLPGHLQEYAWSIAKGGHLLELDDAFHDKLLADVIAKCGLVEAIYRATVADPFHGPVVWEIWDVADNDRLLGTPKYSAHDYDGDDRAAQLAAEAEAHRMNVEHAAKQVTYHSACHCVEIGVVECAPAVQCAHVEAVGNDYPGDTKAHRRRRTRGPLEAREDIRRWRPTAN